MDCCAVVQAAATKSGKAQGCRLFVRVTQVLLLHHRCCDIDPGRPFPWLICISTDISLTSELAMVQHGLFIVYACRRLWLCMDPYYVSQTGGWAVANDAITPAPRTVCAARRK